MIVYNSHLQLSDNFQRCKILFQTSHFRRQRFGQKFGINLFGDIRASMTEQTTDNRHDFVALLRDLYRASASSRSRSSFTKLNTYRHPARFSCHRCSICKAGSVRGITWRLFVLIMIFLSSFFSKLTWPHCNVITSTTRSPQAWKAKKNISKNSLRRGSVQFF